MRRVLRLGAFLCLTRYPRAAYQTSDPVARADARTGATDCRDLFRLLTGGAR